jgi:hypothetical protein
LLEYNTTNYTKVWGSGDVDAVEARNIMQQRLCNLAASEAKIDAAALFGYSSDGNQVCRNFLLCCRTVIEEASNHA